MAKDKVQENTQEEKKEPEFSAEELATLFDELMFQGEYTEEMKLKGKLSITFRTRTADETLEISKKIDVIQANLISTINEQRAVLNLGYSLISYQGKDLSKSTVEERLLFVKKLPVAIIAALTDSLAKFDRKVDMACSEAEENF